MSKVRMSFAASIDYKPKHPDRTARRAVRGGPLQFDVEFQEWTNRAAMARSIRMQEQRESRQDDWRAVVKLTDGEGY